VRGGSRPTALYVSTDLSSFTVADLGSDTLPPAVWAGGRRYAGGPLRVAYRLTPSLYATIARQVDDLERAWARGEFPDGKAEVVAGRWAAIQAWVTDARAAGAEWGDPATAPAGPAATDPLPDLPCRREEIAGVLVAQ
jgi:hypothetical protein